MTRDEAAALLGVPVAAHPDEVRRAWRTWARLAHPDAGGDPSHFARLDRARRVLLVPIVAAPLNGAQAGRAGPAPRRSWSAVLRRPSHPIVIVGLSAIAVAAGAGPAALGLGFPSIASAAVLATLAAIVVARSVLGPEADVGHRIVALAVAWAPVVLGQLVVSTLLGTSLLPVLPLLAVPLVAAVAAVNPGAGLWRPVMCTGWSNKPDISP